MEFQKWRWLGEKWNSKSGGGDSKNGIPKVEGVTPKVEFQKWKDDSRSGIPKMEG